MNINESEAVDTTDVSEVVSLSPSSDHTEDEKRGLGCFSSQNNNDNNNKGPCLQGAVGRRSHEGDVTSLF